MTIHRSCRLALTFALVLFAPSLFAGEIVLFDGENFQGESMVFRDAVADLDPTGFNDRAASISVRDGTWEVCFDANFQGGCMRLAPGDYPRLDPPFNDSISSLRQVGGAEYSGNYPAPAPAPQVGVGFGLPGLSIGINLPLYPELVPVPGYPVYYAPQVDSNYFFYDGMYWVYQRDNWYASSWYNGPWGLIGPEAVPLFVLRVPVRYYRQPPAYFRGWSSDAPPRWGEHWGNSWTQSHRGWDSWNRNAVPAPAPLPTYQRQYSGGRYPAAAQQRALQSQNYHYQPHDAVVRQHYQTQQGAAPVARGQPPQSGSRPAVLAPAQQARPTAQPQVQQSQEKAVQHQQEVRKAQPQVQQSQEKAVQHQQEARKAQPQVQQSQEKAVQHQQEARKAQPQVQQSQEKAVQHQQEVRKAQPQVQQSQEKAVQHQVQQSQEKAVQHQQEARKAQPQVQQSQEKAVQHQQEARKAQPQVQQSQQKAAQHEQQAPKAQGQAKGAEGKGHAKEPKDSQEQRGGTGKQPGGERNQ